MIMIKKRIPAVRSFLFALIVLSAMVLGMPTASSAGVVFSVSFGPPPLPVYEQPLCPGDGYIWTPGYWAYDSDNGDYYWVPGTWVRAPRVGYFWTPGYWAYSGTRFVFYEGYWGPQVGFYGGINYGFGYFGHGYDGGRWDRGQFFYNRSVNNINVTTIHNVYNTTVINRTVNHVSYNGGNGGITARPTRQQEAFARQSHLAPVADQNHHRQLARADREQRASVNHGRPAIAASSRPSDFKDRMPARAAGGTYNPPSNRVGGDQRANRRDVHRPQNNQQANRTDRNLANEQQNERLRRAKNNNTSKNDRPASAVHPRPNDSRSTDVRRSDARPDVRSNDRPRADRPPVTRDSRREQPNPRAVEKPDQERQRVQPRQEPSKQKIARQQADSARRQQAEQQRQNQRAEQRSQQRAPQQRREQPQARGEQQRQRQEQQEPRRQAANRDETKPQ